MEARRWAATTLKLNAHTCSPKNKTRPIRPQHEDCESLQNEHRASLKLLKTALCLLTGLLVDTVLVESFQNQGVITFQPLIHFLQCSKTDNQPSKFNTNVIFHNIFEKSYVRFLFYLSSLHRNDGQEKIFSVLLIRAPFISHITLLGSHSRWSSEIKH